MISLNGRRQYALCNKARIIASADSLAELRALMILGAPWDRDARTRAALELMEWHVVDRHTSTQREVV